MILAQISVGLAHLHLHYSHRFRQLPFNYQDDNCLFVIIYYITYTSISGNCVLPFVGDFLSPSVSDPFLLLTLLSK